jgi:Zn finger protein HypA/HybF involved in hydrogenase expression
MGIKIKIESMREFTCNDCGNTWEENPKVVEGCPKCASYNIS